MPCIVTIIKGIFIVLYAVCIICCCAVVVICISSCVHVKSLLLLLVQFYFIFLIHSCFVILYSEHISFHFLFIASSNHLSMFPCLAVLSMLRIDRGIGRNCWRSCFCFPSPPLSLEVGLP